jgi:hypothetical protein
MRSTLDLLSFICPTSCPHPGLDYVGKPFGHVIAQIAYWSYQLQDAMQVSRLNRKF